MDIHDFDCRPLEAWCTHNFQNGPAIIAEELSHVITRSPCWRCKGTGSYEMSCLNLGTRVLEKHTVVCAACEGRRYNVKADATRVMSVEALG